jgi:hypothetical protein
MHKYMGVVNTAIAEQRIQGNTYGVFCGFWAVPTDMKTISQEYQFATKNGFLLTLGFVNYT